MAQKNIITRIPFSHASPILSRITEIRQNNYQGGGESEHQDETQIHPFRFEYDRVGRLIYNYAGIHPASLDQGADFTPVYTSGTLRIGYRGDFAMHLLNKKLGGSCYLANCYPVSKEVDLTEWNKAIDMIYDHVKAGGKRHALLQFALVYENRRRMCRPSRIYYHFSLRDGEEEIKVMEGQIDNPSPTEDPPIQGLKINDS